MPHLIVISIDALTDEDITRAGSTPNLTGMIGNGAYIRSVNGIYPSLTHPCHATIITGRTPGVHGVISNEDYSRPGHPWFNYLSELRCPSIFTYFRHAGLSSAVCRWPVTAGGFKQIDYLIPEITDEKLIKDDCLGYYLKSSSGNLGDIIRAHIDELRLKEQPQEDLFSTACVCDIIRTFKPDVLFTHPACVDTYKHRMGIRNGKTLEMVRLADSMVGDIIRATKDAGTYEDTVFIVLSDHGHMEVDREIALNELFRRDHMDGSLYADECGHSAQIYLNGISEESALAYLTEKSKDPSSGIERVFGKQELRKRYGTFGDFCIMVESDSHTQFSSDTGCDIERKITVDDHHGCSTHGHMPEKDPRPIFIASGPKIARRLIEEDSMLREAPTFLRIMGLEIPSGMERPLDIFI